MPSRGENHLQCRSKLSILEILFIPRLFASDPTIESLAPLLVARPQGMMLIRDELSVFFANMGRYGGSDRSFWLEAWDGNHYVVERVTKR